MERAWRGGGASGNGAPDVAAPALFPPASGLRRPPYRSRPVDVAEEVEQSRVLGARRMAACPDAGGGTGREK